MQTFLYDVPSLEGVNFTEALAGAGSTGVGPFTASAMNNIVGVPPIGSRRFLIRAITVLALQNFGPELNFFSSSVGQTSDPATDTFIGRWSFTASMGEQIGNPVNPLFRYYIDGLAIPYMDDDAANSTTSPKLHIIMQNIDTIAKSAGAAGNVVVKVRLEPMQSY